MGYWHRGSRSILGGKGSSVFVMAAGWLALEVSLMGLWRHFFMSLIHTSLAASTAEKVQLPSTGGARSGLAAASSL
jgi:hypothetical protein